jgi:stage V sporulation protein K
LSVLDGLVGVTAVRKQIEELEAWAWRRNELHHHGYESDAPTLHMAFSGGPGTGKTTIARLIGGLLKKHKLLRRGHLIEVGRAELVGAFLGETAIKTEAALKSAIGGVLFVDEAYSLSDPSSDRGSNEDYGREALTSLIAGMENHRHELCVIVAGYPAEMERFIGTNAGLRSRISRHIQFPDFSEDELEQVFIRQMESRELTFDRSVLPWLRTYVRRVKSTTERSQWGNARSIRNIVEHAIGNQSVRLRRLGGRPTKSELLHLEASDFTFLQSADTRKL